MQTYSHLILTAALNSRAGRRLRDATGTLPPLRSGALLLGSVLPDLPLITLSIVTIAADTANGLFGAAARPGDGGSLTGRLFDVWFFENPWVISAYNLFHSPVLLAGYLLLGLAAWRRGRAWGSWFFWLSAAAMLHALTDIPLHVNDGPLLLFPFNWQLRFISPISYWDPAHYGRQWAIFEHALDAALLVYVAVAYRRARRVRPPSP